MKKSNFILILLGGILLCTICTTVYADEPFEYKIDGSVYSVHTADGFVAAGSDDKNVYFFDTQGNLKWKKRMDGLVRSVYISDGYVAAGSFIILSESTPEFAENDPGTPIVSIDTQDSHIYFFDISGNFMWKYKTTGGVKSVHISDGYVAAASFKGHVYLLDTQGNLKWEFKNYENLFGGGDAFQSVYISKDKVVAGSDDGSVYFLDINNGELLKKHKTGDTVWDVYSAGDYAAAGSQDGYVYLFDNDGYLKWKEKTDAGVSSVKIYKNYVAVGSNDGYVYLFDINGEKLWEYKEGTFPNEHVWSVDISEEGIVAGTTIFTYLIDLDGKIKWKWPSKNVVRSVSMDENVIASGITSSIRTVGFVNIFEVGKEYKKPIPIINLIVLGIAVLAIIVLAGVVYYLNKKGLKKKKKKRWF